MLKSCCCLRSTTLCKVGKLARRPEMTLQDATQMRTPWWLEIWRTGNTILKPCSSQLAPTRRASEIVVAWRRSVSTQEKLLPRCIYYAFPMRFNWQEEAEKHAGDGEAGVFSADKQINKSDHYMEFSISASESTVLISELKNIIQSRDATARNVELLIKKRAILRIHRLKQKESSSWSAWPKSIVCKWSYKNVRLHESVWFTIR